MDKCANCKKQRDQHNSKDGSCPIGKRHRIYGYTQFKHLDGSDNDSKNVYQRSFDYPEIGKCYLFKGMPVYITDGQSESGGRVSNWWGFRFINEDGTLGKASGCYGNEFTDEIKCKVVTTVIIDKKYFIKF